MITVLGRGLWTVMLVSVNFGLHAQTLDLQERCASLARKAFNEDEARSAEALAKIPDEELSAAAIATVSKSGGPKTEVLSSNYQGHYNPKLDRCFMLVSRTWTTSSRGKNGRTTYLVDAIGGRTYAYYQEPEEEKPSCTLYPSFTKVTYCETSAEFNEFVAGYME